MIYHNKDLSKSKFLITGGAGFIGSNLVKYLINNKACLVRVVDNLSNGFLKNIEDYIELKNFEFIEGDIRNYETCQKAIESIDYVSHQAALGSVPRSLKDPVSSNNVNVNGFLNLLNCVKNSKSVIRMVYASSSSVYGDNQDAFKKEGREGYPLSTYALTKCINESYAKVFEKNYNLKTIGLRYFNVFGPNQFSDSPYAAVIPIFTNSIINDQVPTINGDTNISRDFTYVENIVQANIKSLLVNDINSSLIYNVACGKSTTLMQIIDELNLILNKKIKPKLGPLRKGDILHSKASIENIKNDLNYNPKVSFNQGLRKTVDWMLKNYVR